MPAPPPPSSSRRHSGTGIRQSPFQKGFVFLVAVAIVWGAFAFGAVYAWAYIPLAIVCAAAGLLGVLVGPHRSTHTRSVLLSLAAVALIAAMQLVPLPPQLLAAISPATDRFLETYDLGYALRRATEGTEAAAAAGSSLWYPVSIAPRATLRSLGLLAPLVLFLAGLLRATSSTLALRLARLIAVTGAILAFVGIAQKGLLGDDAFAGMKIYGFWTPESRLSTPFGPFVNKNHFAGWMLLALPLTFGLAMREIEATAHEIGGSLRRRLVWLSEPRGGVAALLVFASLLMMGALVMTRSRSGLACLVLVAVAGCGLAIRRQSLRRSGLWLGTGVTVGLAGVLLWAGKDTAVSRLTADSDSLGLRLDIWRVALTIVRDFPIFGAGLDAFGTATIHYQRSGALHYQEAHNDYLQLLAEGGVVLFTAVALTMAAVVRTIVRRFRERIDRPDLYWVRAGAALGLLGIAAQSFVEFSLQIPGIAVLFTVVLALALYRPVSRHVRS